MNRNKDFESDISNEERKCISSITSPKEASGSSRRKKKACSKEKKAYGSKWKENQALNLVNV